jgi:rare lipoprotein A (peptidoglycan hydrolase)
MHVKNKRLIDVSKEAAKQLGFFKKGITKVQIEIIENDLAIRHQNER